MMIKIKKKGKKSLGSEVIREKNKGLRWLRTTNNNGRLWKIRKNK